MAATKLLAGNGFAERPWSSLKFQGDGHLRGKDCSGDRDVDCGEILGLGCDGEACSAVGTKRSGATEISQETSCDCEDGLTGLGEDVRLHILRDISHELRRQSFPASLANKVGGLTTQEGVYTPPGCTNE